MWCAKAAARSEVDMVLAVRHDPRAGKMAQPRLNARLMSSCGFNKPGIMAQTPEGKKLHM
jgi:hypothetical protein